MRALHKGYSGEDEKDYWIILKIDKEFSEYLQPRTKQLHVGGSSEKSKGKVSMYNEHLDIFRTISDDEFKQFYRIQPSEFRIEIDILMLWMNGDQLSMSDEDNSALNEVLEHAETA